MHCLTLAELIALETVIIALLTYLTSVFIPEVRRSWALSSYSGFCGATPVSAAPHRRRQFRRHHWLAPSRKVAAPMLMAPASPFTHL